MKSFEKLLDTVRKSNPNLITEEQAQAMLDEYNAGLTDMQSTSFENGKAAGFEEGYREGMEKQKAVCKQEMDELLEKCDEDATNKLEAIIDMINKDHAAKLQEVYDYCMKTMVPVKEVEAMDADHAEKFQTAIDAINNDHANKLETAVESINKDHTKKMLLACKAVANSLRDAVKTDNLEYEAKISELKKKALVMEQRNEVLKKRFNEEKERKLNFLTESVEKYLNYALKDSIPTKKLISEAKYSASQKAIEKITSILKINNILQESKDGIFNDYEAKLNEAKNEQNKLHMENIELKAKLEKEEAKLLLESKISKCTPAEAAFLRSFFVNAKNAKVIEEQIEDARSAYKRIHLEKRAAMADTIKNEVSSKPSSVVNEHKERPAVKNEPPKKVIAESKKQAESTATTSLVNVYANLLKNNNF